LYGRRDAHDHGCDGNAGPGPVTTPGAPATTSTPGTTRGCFRQRFWLSLALTIPLVLTSEMAMDWFGYELDFPGMSLLAPVLGSTVLLWGGWPFLRGAVTELKNRQPEMMLLIAMAISVAYVASMATSIGWFDLEAAGMGLTAAASVALKAHLLVHAADDRAASSPPTRTGRS
jgi:Cu2+-exporting ATPase